MAHRGLCQPLGTFQNLPTHRERSLSLWARAALHRTWCGPLSVPLCRGCPAPLPHGCLPKVPTPHWSPTKASLGRRPLTSDPCHPRSPLPRHHLHCTRPLGAPGCLVPAHLSALTVPIQGGVPAPHTRVCPAQGSLGWVPPQPPGEGRGGIEAQMQGPAFLGRAAGPRWGL